MPTAGSKNELAYGIAQMVVSAADHHDTADSLSSMLRHWGYTVQTVYDGPSGVKVAAEFHPAAAIVDIGLPGLDGYQVARKLREDQPHEPPLLVAISGYGREIDRQRSAQAGFDHHFSKPVEARALQGLLARRLAEAHATSC